MKKDVEDYIEMAFKKFDECCKLVEKGMDFVFKSIIKIPVGTKIKIKKGSTVYIGNGITATITNDVEAIVASTNQKKIKQRRKYD